MDISCDAAFFGHSLISQSDFRENFTNAKIVNLGYGGDGVKKMIRRVQQVGDVHPRMVFFMCGTNDLKVSDSDFEIAYSNLIDSIITTVPDAQIIVHDILPMTEAKLKRLGVDKKQILQRNEVIRQISRNRGLDFVELHGLYIDENGYMKPELTSDGVHLKPDTGYLPWADAIAKYFE